MKRLIIISILIFLVKTKGLVLNDVDQMHPVHSLFVKPSIDGSTGDLYVAATEENGIKSQWLADPSVNILSNTPSTVSGPPKSEQQQKMFALPISTSQGRIPYIIATNQQLSPYAKGYFQNPYQIYPQLSAIANIVNSLYGGNDQKGSSSMLPASALWPNTYPYPYVVMAPKSWTRSEKADDASRESTSSEDS